MRPASNHSLPGARKGKPPWAAFSDETLDRQNAVTEAKLNKKTKSFAIFFKLFFKPFNKSINLPP